MTDSPPPLDYQPPPPKPSGELKALAFAGGVIVGGMLFLAGTAVAVGAVADVAQSKGRAPLMEYTAPFVTPLLLVVGGLAMARTPDRRPFGLGLVASVPITLMTAFMVCGAMR